MDEYLAPFFNLCKITSVLRLLALHGLRTLRVRTRAFGPRVEEKLSRISKFEFY